MTCKILIFRPRCNINIGTNTSITEDNNDNSLSRIIIKTLYRSRDIYKAKTNRNQETNTILMYLLPQIYESNI